MEQSMKTSIFGGFSCFRIHQARLVAGAVVLAQGATLRWGDHGGRIS